MHTYFLGANSRTGFYSLYGSFPPEDDAFLHVIKGGPGTGKSTLLRAIAGAAEARGLEVHRVLCSGDPDSLDGVYLPALGQAWVDGTAPHTLEPALFGVTGDYLNLGAFLARPFDEKEKRDMRRLQQAYQELYRQAYRELAACGEAGDGQAEASGADECAAISETILSALRPGRLRRRFLSAITGKGVLTLEEELQGYAQTRTRSAALASAAEQLEGRGGNAVLCPSPLDPAQPEFLLLPEEKLAFRSVYTPGPEEQRHLDEAVSLLRRAKALHDELEAAYRPHMDFPAISKYTQAIIDAIAWK